MWVIKIGGSLARSEGLAGWLARLLAEGARRWLLVPGGGPYADAVREMQQRWQFDDPAAHRMALQAMALFGMQLKAMAPALGLCEGLEPPGSDARCAVWVPGSEAASQLTGLPQDWRLSSDSIALWLAMSLGAEGLVLLKSVPPPVAEAGASALAAAGYIDAAFPDLLREARLPVFWTAASAPWAPLPEATEAGRRIWP